MSDSAPGYAAKIEALIAERDQLRSAVADAVQRQWQPIETAPKDGSHVLVSDGFRVSLGGWVRDIDYGADYEGQLGMAGWWAVDLGPNGDKPTHWQPFPPPAAAIRATPAQKDTERKA